jgi:hypothetical protein
MVGPSAESVDLVVLLFVRIPQLSRVKLSQAEPSQLRLGAIHSQLFFKEALQKALTIIQVAYSWPSFVEKVRSPLHTANLTIIDSVAIIVIGRNRSSLSLEFSMTTLADSAYFRCKFI